MSVTSKSLTFLCAVTAGATFAGSTFIWDGAAGNNKLDDSGNWYVNGSSERRTITSDDAIDSQGSYHVLDSDYAFEVGSAVFGGSLAVVDIKSGTFKVDGLLNLGYWGRKTEFNVKGGTVDVKKLQIGDWCSHTGYNTMNVSVGEVHVTESINLGAALEARGDLTIKGGSVAAQGSVYVGNCDLTKLGGAGTDYDSSITVSGDGRLSVTGTVHVANTTGAGGKVNLSGGETYVSSNVEIGCGSGAQGQVAVAGAKLTVDGTVKVGNAQNAGASVLDISGGETQLNKLEIGDASGAVAKVNVTGGTLNVADVTYVGNASGAQPAMLVMKNADVTMKKLAPGKNSEGSVYLLKDSTLSVETFAKDQGATGTARLYADGSTVELTSSYEYTLSSFETIEIGADGIVFDTGTHNPKIQAFTAMTGVGGITKKGSGTLKIDPKSFGFAGDYKAHGKIVVEAGTLRMPTGQTFYCTGTNVAAGATLNLNGSTLVIIDEKNRVSRSAWTDAMGDHDATNPYNWTSTVEFFKDGKVLSDLTDTLYVCPTSETSVRVPYGATISNFDPTAYASVDYVIDSDKDVSFITDLGKSYDDYTASLTVSDANVKIANSFNALLKSAVAWYDPSDASTLTLDETNGVKNVVNKGTAGSTLNLKTYSSTSFPTYGTQTDSNGLGALAFENEAKGFVSEGGIALDNAAGISLLGVCERAKAEKDTQVFPIEVNNGTDWNDHGLVGLAQWPWYVHVAVAAVTNDVRAVLAMTSGMNNDSGVPHILGVTAGATSATAFTGCKRSTGVFIKEDSSKVTYDRLDTVENSQGLHYINYGMRRENPCGSTGWVGEAFVFNKTLSETETAALNTYLWNKWFDADDMTIATNATTIASLTLEGAEVDCDGAPVSVGTLSGAGTLSNHAGVTVTGALKITFDAEGNPNAITCNGAFTMDANATVEASEEVLAAVRAYLLSAKQPVTVVTATSVTLPKKILVKDASGRTFQLVKKGNTLVFEIQPSFTIHVR